jgi:hypothetical protein
MINAGCNRNKPPKIIMNTIKLVIVAAAASLLAASCCPNAAPVKMAPAPVSSK